MVQVTTVAREWHNGISEVREFRWILSGPWQFAGCSGRAWEIVDLYDNRRRKPDVNTGALQSQSWCGFRASTALFTACKTYYLIDQQFPKRRRSHPHILLMG